MKIEHLAIWVSQLEKMKIFYETYFDAKAGTLYHNPAKQFSSYFLQFADGCRLELMHRPDITASDRHPEKQSLGFIHFAISTGSAEKVDALTNRLRKDGYMITGEPRHTGDGYYESVVLDPEGNIIELTV